MKKISIRLRAVLQYWVLACHVTWIIRDGSMIIQRSISLQPTFQLYHSKFVNPLANPCALHRALGSSRILFSLALVLLVLQPYHVILTSFRYIAIFKFYTQHPSKRVESDASNLFSLLFIDVRCSELASRIKSINHRNTQFRMRNSFRIVSFLF